LPELGKIELLSLSPKEKLKNTKKDESERRNKLTRRAMVGVIFIADMMSCVDQRVGGKRSKPYQQKDCCGLEHSISLELDHSFSLMRRKTTPYKICHQ
jgi:hypothetical protein